MECTAGEYGGVRQVLDCCRSGTEVYGRFSQTVRKYGGVRQCTAGSTECVQQVYSRVQAARDGNTVQQVFGRCTGRCTEGVLQVSRTLRQVYSLYVRATPPGGQHPMATEQRLDL